jgi:hypothetical protein
MSFNQTYYLDIDSNYRDESVYPNPTDFTIPFKTNTSTGYYALGEPLNTESYFEGVSIDPNFANDNINITNGYVTNIKILDTTVFVSGIIFPGNTTFRYLNTGILSITGVCTRSAFLSRFDITELGDVPYNFNWIVYSDSFTGNSETLRSTFTFDLVDNIYWMFDSANYVINIYYLSNITSRTLYTNIINTENPGLNTDLNLYLSVNTQPISNSLIALYFDQNGNKGTYDNHDWGYHILSDPKNNLNSSNGNFNIAIDNGNNLIISFNSSYYTAYGYTDKVFAASTTTGSSGATLIGTLPTGSSGWIQQYPLWGPQAVSFFSNSGTNYVLTNMVYTDPGVANGATRQPYYCISIDTATGTTPYSQVLLPNPTVNVSQPQTVYNIIKGSDIYLILTYTRYSSATTGVSYPLNIYKYTDNYTTGYVIASSSGPISYRAFTWPVLFNDDIYIPVRRAELDRTFIMYKYNIPTNSVLDVATGACTGSTSDFGRILSYEMSGCIYSLVMERSNNYIFEYNTSTNILRQVLSYVTPVFNNASSNTSYITDFRQDGTKYVYISYRTANPYIIVLKVNDPNNITVTTVFVPFANGALTSYQFKLKDNTYRTFLFSQFVGVGNIYDFTNPTGYSTIYSGRVNGCGISPSGIGYNPYNFRGFSAHYLWKTNLFEPIKINSVHYNINEQSTLSLDSNYIYMDKFKIANYNYFVLANSTKFTIYITTSIVNTSNVIAYSYILPASLLRLKSYYFNNYVYILIISTNYYIIYKSNLIDSSNIPNINSFSSYYTDTPSNLTDVALGYSGNNLILSVTTTTYYKAFNINFTPPTETLSYTITSATIIGAYTNFLYNPNNGLNYLFFFENDLISAGASYRTAYLINSNNTFTLQYFRSSNINGVGQKQLFAINGNFAQSVARLYTNTSTWVNPVDLGFTAVPDTNNAGRATTAIDVIPYLNGFLTAFSNVVSGISYLALGTQIVFGNNTTLSSTTIRMTSSINDIAIIQTETLLYVLVLLNDSTLYLYNINNITFASNYQTLTKVSKLYQFDPNFSASFIHKILQDGTPSNMNFIGSSFYEPTPINNNIAISNFDITDNYTSIICAGTWRNNVYFKQETSTGYITTNYLTDSIGSLNSFIINYDISFKSNYVIPLIGPISNIINKLQINDSINYTSFVGTSSSKYFYIYNPQLSGTLTMPTIIQYIFNIISTSNGFLVSIDNTTGLLVNKLLVFTNDQSRNITILDLTIDEYQTAIVGTSNANNLIILSNDVLYDQILYSNINFSNSFNIFMYVISNSGALLYSNLIDCGPSISVSIQDIKQDSDLNRIYFTPYFTLASGTGPISIYNRDGSLAKRDVVIGGSNFYSLTFQYIYDPLYTDKNGSQYSQVVYINPPSYPFEDENFNNYILFLIGNIDNVDVNGNYYVRYNEYDGTNYKLILNTIIDPTTIIKQFSTINGITGSNNHFNMQLSSSYLEGYVVYDLNTVPNAQNEIVAISEIAAIDIDQFYYFMIPFQSSTGPINKLIPITSIDINAEGNYVFTVDNINDLRVSLPSGSFFGPYLPIVIPNDKLYSVIPFFGSSIFIPIYYNITLDSITLPNRPIKNLPIPGVRSFNDIPFFYVSIYPVDDEGNYDPETVNVVYTNTKLLVLPTPIFKIQSSSTNPDDNFVTFNSLTTPIIKFDKDYANLRITIYDPDGEVILFDTSPTKFSDEDFLYGILPTTLTNLYLRITLTKR